jgi:low affinity Fe/Cu permease
MNFRAFADKINYLTGRAWAFALAFGFILLWGVGGIFEGFSTDYQLIVNTGTTIVTFLMVFVIQNSTFRDMSAIQLKLDELIRASTARNILIAAEKMSEKELQEEITNLQALCDTKHGKT